MVGLAASAFPIPRARTIVQDLLKPEAAKPGPCQVRSKTDRPCPRQAVVEIWGLPFCERCAREQEAYFAIGEMTQELTDDRANQAQGFHHIEPLVKALN
jgi:hypothetical protein